MHRKIDLLTLTLPVYLLLMSIIVKLCAILPSAINKMTQDKKKNNPNYNKNQLICSEDKQFISTTMCFIMQSIIGGLEHEFLKKHSENRFVFCSVYVILIRWNNVGTMQVVTLINVLDSNLKCKYKKMSIKLCSL